MAMPSCKSETNRSLPDIHHCQSLPRRPRTQ